MSDCGWLVGVVDSFAELFQGRNDAYGADAGGCERVSCDEWDGWLWRQHLEGHTPIGVYPIIPPDALHRARTVDCVHWGCVDFDIRSDNHPTYDYETEQEAHEAASNLVRVLHHLGIVGWIERTRSHGRHVWVFASEWTPAHLVRRTLLVAASVAGVSAREVNPKQETLAEGQLGNYVRLPYPGMVPADGGLPACGSRRLILRSDGGIYGFEPFLRDALARRSAPDVYAQAAALWQPPPEPKPITRVAFVEGDYPRYVRKMIEGGPMDGSDRSTFLARLAHKCFESGMTIEAALAAQYEADDIYGKFVGRRDREKQLMNNVERAYT